MRRLLFLLFLVSHMFTYGQSKKIQLSEAIKIAQKKSPEYVRALNTHQRSYWRYRNYVADFLPQVSLDATLPEYSNSTTRIINDQGQYIFVKQNQSAIETNLRIQQKVPFTGGAFFISTQLDRVNRLGIDKSTNYSFVPFSINYFQNSLFFNPYK